MTDEPLTSRCFRCGGSAHELNELEEGVSCPACAERLVETVQGIFHTPWGDAVAHQGTESELEREPDEEHIVRGPRRMPGPMRLDDQGPRRA